MDCVDPLWHTGSFGLSVSVRRGWVGADVLTGANFDRYT